MRILLISILGLLMLASCTKQEPIEALIDRVFTVAEQQYTAEDALRSAAYTYVVAALGSLATLVYYIMIFMGIRD